MKLNQFAFINYKKYFIYFYTFYDHLFHYQNTLPTPISNAEFTRRLYSVPVARPQRAHDALEDPTALPQRAVKHAVQTPSRGVCFKHAQNKRRRMAFYAIAQRKRLLKRKDWG